MLPKGAVSPCLQAEERQLRMARQMMTSFWCGKLRPFRVVFGLEIDLSTFCVRLRASAKRRWRAGWGRSCPSSSRLAPRCSASRKAALNRAIRQAGMTSKGAAFISFRHRIVSLVPCGGRNGSIPSCPQFPPGSSCRCQGCGCPVMRSHHASARASNVCPPRPSLW
jgi:hypothetical protein